MTRHASCESEEALVDDTPSGPSAQQVAGAIARGVRPAERLFDRFLADELRGASSQHWTPLNVALRVAEWLNRLEVETVVDIGSGAGKLCVAAALATRCSFIGLEQRPRLVAAASELAAIFGVEQRVRFIQGTLSERAVPQADAYYLYNPFAENLFVAQDRLDHDVELGRKRYRRDIALLESFLRQAPVGTYLIEHHGFGGQVPDSYDLLREERDMSGPLRMWRRTRPSGSMDQQRDIPER